MTVGSAAADTDGSHLAAPYSGAFTTVAAGLGVDAVVPADGVAGIGVRTPIAVMFDGPIDPASVDGAIRITPEIGGETRIVERTSDAPAAAPPSADAGARRRPGAVASGPGTVLLFTPSSPLAQHTTYTVELAPIVQRAGDPGQVAAGRTWTFTTGGQTTSAQNQIAFLSDRGGIRNVWLMNPDGSNPRQITTELAPVSAYDVASDGRSLVYAAGGVIRQAKVDGTDADQLTPTGLLEYAPTLAPAGAGVLVGRRDLAGADLGWWLEPLAGGTASGSARQLLPTGAPPPGSIGAPGDGLVAGPGVSPWSSRAAFDPTGRWLVLVTPDGQVVHLTWPRTRPNRSPWRSRSRAPTGVPAWDPAGAAFMVTGTAPGRIGSRPDRAERHGHRRPVPGGRSGRRREPGRDRRRSSPRPATTSATRRAAPDRRSRLTGTADLADRTPGFSPDGTTLLFARVVAADPTRSAGIWLSDLDGRDLRQLSTDGAPTARWLP